VDLLAKWGETDLEIGQHSLVCAVEYEFEVRVIN